MIERTPNPPFEPADFSTSADFGSTGARGALHTLVLEFQSKRKRLWIGAGVLVVLVGVALLYGPLQGAWARRQAEIALASAHHCLFGPPPAPGEQPSGRIRRIFLAGAPEGWPARCDRHVRHHLEARKDSESSSNPEADAYAHMGAEAQLADVARGSMGVTQFSTSHWTEQDWRRWWRRVGG